MSENVEFISNEELLAKWLEKDLSVKEQEVFERRCIHDAEFSEQVQSANQLNLLAETSSDFKLAPWDKHRAFEPQKYQKRQPWWQWQGLPMTSFVCSAFALVMVVSEFNIQQTEGRLSFGFGTQLSEQKIERVVNAKLVQQQEQQQSMFAQYLSAMQRQQSESNTQLTEYLLSSSRHERRQDFAELIEYINEQRIDDQQFYANQFRDFQQEFSFQVSANDAFTSPDGKAYKEPQFNE